MNPRIIAGLAALVLGTPSAFADKCPPSVNDFDTWTWIPSWNSGDDWVTGDYCATATTRNAAKALVVDHMGLGANWSYWANMLSAAEICDPNKWGGRVIAGGYATELVGRERDNDTFTHWASPGGVLPNGNPVTRWLSQYVDLYVGGDEGYKWRCLADGDAAGPGDGFTFASNPSTNSACSVYYPWFWNKTVMDRASTLVHEATHEFSGHLSDSACSNGASCDTSFMAANAQTFQLIFDAQAIDAYQREPGGRDLQVVNLGNDVCGYLPLLPDLDRFALVAVMRNKLQNVFQTTPPASAYPASANIDSVPGTIWDRAGNPGGQSGTAYRIDIVNGARWECGKVCNPNDFNWPNGSRACNETFQQANVGINQQNRQRCVNLNAQLAAGVTSAEYASLRSQAKSMLICREGVDQHYIDEVCGALIPNANHVDDIDAQWPIPEDLGFSYSAEKAIHDCQVRFCGAQGLDDWDGAAREVCYEWDDPAGCMPLLCGDLGALDPEPGRESLDYFQSVVCRASELGRRIPGVREEDVGCSAVFNDCIVEERYFPLWTQQLEGDDCWSDSLPAPTPDPFHVGRRLAIGSLPADRYIVSDRGPGLLRSSCLMKEMQCEALQAAMQAALAKILTIRYEARPPWEDPPGPDPWEGVLGRYDRELARLGAALGDELANAPMDAVPLYRDARLRQMARPEARVAISELVGQDTFFAVGGARNAEAAFNPARMAQFGGAEAERDPYGVPTDGLEDELAALATLTARVESRAWQAEIERAPALGEARYYAHVEALLAARSGEALLAAHDALAADLAALRQ